MRSSLLSLLILTSCQTDAELVGSPDKVIADDWGRDANSVDASVVDADAEREVDTGLARGDLDASDPVADGGRDGPGDMGPGPDAKATDSSVDPVHNLEACVHGRAFAECPCAASDPNLRCPGLSGCLWFAGGCAPPRFDIDCSDFTNCRPEESGAGWGLDPWTRDRAMVLDVLDLEALEVPPVAVECTECTLDGSRHECFLDDDLCSGGPIFAAASYFRGQPGDWLEIELRNAEVRGSTQMLLVEVDLSRSRGRACILWRSDALSDREPLCAVSGSLELLPGPDGAHGVLRLEFGPHSPFFDPREPLTVSGFTLDARF